MYYLCIRKTWGSLLVLYSFGLLHCYSSCAKPTLWIAIPRTAFWLPFPFTSVSGFSSVLISKSQCVAQFLVHLAYFMVSWENDTSIQTVPPSDWPVNLSVGQCLDWWFVGKGTTHCCWCSSWAGDLETYIEENWASRQEQSNRYAALCSLP